VRSSRPRAAALLVLLVAASPLGGCTEAGYILRQAKGQLRILRERERIVDLLSRRGLDEPRRRRLEIVLLVREWAHDELGLVKTAAYTRYYDTGGSALAWNLIAAYKDRLEPVVFRFPIVGGLPYKGYFEKERALEAQRAFEARGFDTHLRAVEAYSSLGYFADPVYSPMLEDTVARLVEVVIHETTHATIFLRDQVAFNESLASFVGDQGALDFLARLYGPESNEVRRQALGMRRDRAFAGLLDELHARVERLYASVLPRERKLALREAHFAWAKRRYAEIFPDPSSWGAFGRRRLNNAVLLSYGTYKRGLEFQRAVYAALGRDLSRMVALYRQAQELPDPLAAVSRWTGVRAFPEDRM
jgi:predicted aminopeptidase